MANTSTVHFFVDKTITAGNVTEQMFSTRTICVWFAVQNNHATKTLYVKTSTADDATNAVAILPGEYKVVGVLRTGVSPYDLSEYRFFSDTTAHPFMVEYMKA